MMKLFQCAEIYDFPAFIKARVVSELMMSGFCVKTVFHSNNLLCVSEKS
jgi:hypothetical protein